MSDKKPMEDTPRLIEHAFPLEQASLDSVQEKSARHGHIASLHIWPARRPLAACRAAIIATLLPDPGTPESRKALVEKIGGTVDGKTEKKRMPNGRVIERIKRFTQGGILHWIGTEPKSGGRKKIEEHRAAVAAQKTIIEELRTRLRENYGNRPPRVLDPFSGGGAIPLEALRLGCDVTAVDINPVAWFILKTTLEHPKRLSGKSRPLPPFILNEEDFLNAFYKTHPNLVGHAKPTKRQLREHENSLPGMSPHEDRNATAPNADLAWHLRAWGHWILARARAELAQFYPTYADYEPLTPGAAQTQTRPRQLVPLTSEGNVDTAKLNATLSPTYLLEERNPRYVAKPTLAYLWARTVTCKNCRATVPLLKTLWLSKTSRRRTLLTITPNKERKGIDFDVATDIPVVGGNAAQRREHDKRISAGTMTRSGVSCPCCTGIMTMEDIRQESLNGRSGLQITAIAVEGQNGKEFRPPTPHELRTAQPTQDQVQQALGRIPLNTLDQPFAPASTRSISAQLYGVRRWRDLFTERQLLSIATFGRLIRESLEEMKTLDYPSEWRDALTDSLCLSLDRMLCFTCVNACWKPDVPALNWAFPRYSISLLWDFAEAQPLCDAAGSFVMCNERIAVALDNLIKPSAFEGTISIAAKSATEIDSPNAYDLVITDPPYYQAVSYADLSDFFYVWLRGIRPTPSEIFEQPLTEKKREIVQHIRDDKDRDEEKNKYEDQMAAAFSRTRDILTPHGRFVCVFAHKDPIAWETLVSAIIRAGFVVTASWPIQTEMPSRQRASASASLASSVWLVCKKRPVAARPGFDEPVLQEMRANIGAQLREFWDAGIRGPDFVWAATGPALESYSKYPAVKKARDPGKLMDVSEFLRQVRRIVVDFVVGRVLSPDKDTTEATGLDDATTYYLLHRHDFGLEETPAGPCILYAVSCNLSDAALADQYDILARAGGADTDEEEDEAQDLEQAEPETEDAEGTGSKLRLKQWNQRNNPMMGYDPAVDSARARSDAMQMKFLEEDKEPPRRRQIPLIDQAHRLMHLWKAGDRAKVDDYLEVRALVRHKTFLKLLQALIELAPHGSDERSMLEKISNHIAARGGTDQMAFDTGAPEQTE